MGADRALGEDCPDDVPSACVPRSVVATDGVAMPHCYFEVDADGLDHTHPEVVVRDDVVAKARGCIGDFDSDPEEVVVLGDGSLVVV